MFLSIIAVGLSLMANAQQTEKQMATLQHGEQTTVFYGPDAFKSAYNAAADTLDVITLSSGEFNVPSQISKSVAVYGVGFENVDSLGIKMTYLRSGLKLIPANITDGDGEIIAAAKRVNGVHLEGLRINGDITLDNNSDVPIHNLEVVKCRLNRLYYIVACYDNVIRQCVIHSGILGRYADNLLVSNTYLHGRDYSGCIKGFGTTSVISISHCLLKNHYNEMNNTALYTNNIFIGGNTNIDAASTVRNCMFVDNASFSGVMSVDNFKGLKGAAVWAAEGEDGEYSENKDFALKYPEKYIGTDGTEIGLHGGVYVWNKIPCIPRITECTLDTKDAANGTIRVSIKAEAQTKE